MSQEFTKEAQTLEKNPVYVAEVLEKIIRVMIDRMSPESRVKSIQNVRNRVNSIQAHELSTKKSPGGAAVGASISLVRNTLNSRDPYFINVVLKELSKRLV
jgi:hypothetical protein